MVRQAWKARQGCRAAPHASHSLTKLRRGAAEEGGEWASGAGGVALPWRGFGSRLGSRLGSPGRAQSTGDAGWEPCSVRSMACAAWG